MASAPRRRWAICGALVAAAALGTTLAPPPWQDGVFVGCWISVAVTGAAGLLPRTDGGLAYGLSLNAGLWSGALAALAGTRLDLLAASPCLALLIPAAWAARHVRFPLVRVASSWLVAVAILAVALSALPVTPGYLPDHLE